MDLNKKVEYINNSNILNKFYSNDLKRFKDMLTLDKELFIDIILSEFTSISKEINIPLKDINIEEVLKYYLNGNGSYSDVVSITRYY